MSEIGEYIRNLRRAKNYSQRKLAYLSGVSNATINRVENGISLPDPDTLKKLAGPLGAAYTGLLDKAGYLDKKKFMPSNMRIIREKRGKTHSQLAEDISKVTGSSISPQQLESLENGAYEEIPPEAIDTIARYEGVDPEFLFRENTPEDLEYAVRKFPYRKKACGEGFLPHVEDEDLRNWVCNPASLDYLAFAKKVSDIGVNPDFILSEFVNKIFKRKK